MFAAAVGDTSGFRGLGLGLRMKFRARFFVGALQSTQRNEKGVLRASKLCATD